jgi:YesN/AraC family two-component response regulator
MAQGMTDKIIAVVSPEYGNNFYSALSGNGTKISVVPFTHSKEVIHKNGVDVVLLDCCNDGETGLSWLTEFKKVKKTVPVIFITGVKSHDLVVRAYKLGVRDYFTKPVSISELNRTVTKLLSFKNTWRETRKSLSCHSDYENCKLTNALRSDIPSSLLCAVHYIENNLEQSLTLHEIAQQANLSKYHFTRLFKRLTGFSPLEFAIILKMHKAKKLLMKKDLPITLVAEDVGYFDLRNFDRRFKEHTGLTPSSYRKSRHSIHL